MILIDRTKQMEGFISLMLTDDPEDDFSSTIKLDQLNENDGIELGLYSGIEDSLVELVLDREEFIQFADMVAEFRTKLGV